MSHGFEEALINEVKKYNIIYNSYSNDFYKVLKKQKVWKQIAKKLNRDESTCKKKWRNLRDSYHKQKKQEEKLDPDKVKLWLAKKKWKYYFQLSFLDGTFAERPASKKSIKDEDTDDTQFSFETNTIDALEDPMDELPMQDDVWQVGVDQQHAKNEIDEDVIDNDEHYTELLQISPVPSNKRPAEKPAESTEKDSTELLFETLAKKLKEANLPEPQRSTIECKVMNLVYNEINHAPLESSDLYVRLNKWEATPPMLN